MPLFTIPVHESNDCHTPAGSPAGGQFCGSMSRREGQPIPEPLKDKRERGYFVEVPICD